MLAAYAAFALLLPATNADTVEFRHEFAVNSTSKYAISFSSAEPPFSVAANVTSKVLKADDKGAEVEFTLADMMMKAPNGGDSPAPAPPAKAYPLDRFGLITKIDTGDPNFLIILHRLVFFLPDAPMAAGSSVDIDWKTEDATYKGKAEFTGMKEVDGVKLAELKINATFKPGTQEPGTFAITTLYDPARKRIVKTEADLKVPQSSLKLTATEIK